MHEEGRRGDDIVVDFRREPGEPVSVARLRRCQQQADQFGAARLDRLPHGSDDVTRLRNAHDGNIVTFHTVKDFRRLVY